MKESIWCTGDGSLEKVGSTQKIEYSYCMRHFGSHFVFFPKSIQSVCWSQKRFRITVKTHHFVNSITQILSTVFIFISMTKDSGIWRHIHTNNLIFISYFDPEFSLFLDQIFSFKYLDFSFHGSVTVFNKKLWFHKTHIFTTNLADYWQQVY